MHAVSIRLDLASQPAMHHLTEKRRQVRGIVEANQRQMFRIGSFQQVQTNRSLTEYPYPRQAQPENPAEQHAVHGVVGNHEQRLLRLKSITGPVKGAPRPGHDLFQGLATGKGHKMRSLPPSSAASFISLLHFRIQASFPIAMGDLHQIRVEGQGN